MDKCMCVRVCLSVFVSWLECRVFYYFWLVNIGIKRLLQRVQRLFFSLSLSLDSICPPHPIHSFVVVTLYAFSSFTSCCCSCLVNILFLFLLLLVWSCLCCTIGVVVVTVVAWLKVRFDLNWLLFWYVVRFFSVTKTHNKTIATFKFYCRTNLSCPAPNSKSVCVIFTSTTTSTRTYTTRFIQMLMNIQLQFIMYKL